LQRACDFACDPNGVLHWQLPLTIHFRADRLAINKRHHIEEGPFGFARVVRRKDVRMGETGGDLDLAVEPIRANGGREVGVEQLDGNSAVELRVNAEVYRGHTPTPELTLYAVSVAEGR
jgi:hypothetical protein